MKYGSHLIYLFWRLDVPRAMATRESWQPNEEFQRRRTSSIKLMKFNRWHITQNVILFENPAQISSIKGKRLKWNWKCHWDHVIELRYWSFIHWFILKSNTIAISRQTCFVGAQNAQSKTMTVIIYCLHQVVGGIWTSDINQLRTNKNEKIFFHCFIFAFAFYYVLLLKDTLHLANLIQFGYF